MPYPEERALEDAAYGHGLTPVRVFAVLLPVWRVEVLTTDGRPYALTDRLSSHTDDHRWPHQFPDQSPSLGKVA
ncbi:hypothetical protein [Amycolatopsis sp. NPDC098790]|uniref:hypothetical protein n=1 Tax=Amycolatopsis sp. NPDC098790 TaxID=3363939 RepID=UPI00382704CF